MDEKKANNHEEVSDKYALYTEKIVQSPKVKYKKYINGFRVAVMFLVALWLFMLFITIVMPWYTEKLVKKPEQRDELTIEKDEYNEEGLSEGSDSPISPPSHEPAETPQEDDHEAVMTALRSRVTEIQKCVIAVDKYSSSVNQLVQEESSETEVCGLIMGYVNSEYLIITSASAIGDVDNVIIRFSTGEEMEGLVTDRDTTTNMAIISIRAVEMSYTMMQSVKVATLDNSYNVDQGDLFLAYGKLYGQNRAVDYGTISGISSQSGTDNNFEIFHSDLLYNEGDFSFIFNANGNAIGVTTVTEDGNLTAMGISDLKGLLEAMTNKGGYAYFGVRGHNITGSMAELYDFPMGIYISEVEMDSPAYNAGLWAGDIICGINGNSVLTIQVFSEKLYQCSGGQSVYVKAMRQGKDGYYNVNFNVTVQMK